MSEKPTSSFKNLAAAVLAATLEATVPAAHAADAPVAPVATLSPQAKSFSAALNMEITTQKAKDDRAKALNLNSEEATKLATAIRDNRDAMSEQIVQSGKANPVEVILDEGTRRKAIVNLSGSELKIETQKVVSLTEDRNKPNYGPDTSYTQTLGPMVQMTLAKTPEEQAKLMKEAMAKTKAGTTAPKP